MIRHRLSLPFTLLLTLLALFSLSAQAAGFSARVDRVQLSEGETVELTLESDDITLFGKPDLSPLNELFEQLGTRQLNQISSNNGNAHSTTSWVITLQPKQTGYVVIPPIQLGDVSSQPITLHVLTAASQKAQGKLAPVFIEASLDQDNVYVQAQAILTLRIYHSVSLYDDSSLTPLQMTNARIEQLGEPRTYEKLLNGVRHGVIELRYGIFPQQSGELTIPALQFSATVASARQNNDFSPFDRPGRPTRVNSAPINLQVKAKPAQYPADAAWLPARALTLSEDWSPQPDKVKVGDSLTRILKLNAEGLSSAQLPPLPSSSIAGLRNYPDQPQLSNQINEQGLLGSREEREALVPNRSGTVDLPAIELPWWNTQTDTLEHLSLPARQLEVAANPGLESPTSNEPPALLPAIEGPPLWPWQLACAVLASTTLLGFGLWWRARRQPAIAAASQTGPSPRTLLDDLKRACQSNEPQATRQALDAWARQQPETLADLAARFLPLSAALDGLNGALYSETGQHWQGEDLWRAIRTLPAAESVGSSAQEPSPLPPLYPR
ncbi:MAG: BatD family protein [Pseudomonadaceae bacterium]|nr:BatD family protein [Pseudomonadaceae bacterium]